MLSLSSKLSITANMLLTCQPLVIMTSSLSMSTSGAAERTKSLRLHMAQDFHCEVHIYVSGGGVTWRDIPIIYCLKCKF